jgi:hypothetical protein
MTMVDLEERHLDIARGIPNLGGRPVAADYCVQKEEPPNCRKRKIGISAIPLLTFALNRSRYLKAQTGLTRRPITSPDKHLRRE